MANVITALDIGSASIKGVVAEVKKDNTLGVVAAFNAPSAGLRKGVLIDVEEALPSFRSLVIDLQKISKKAAQNIFVTLNGEQVKSKVSRAAVAVARADQEIQKDDVERVIQACRAVKISPNSLVLHNITREFIVDDIADIHDPVGMTGNRLEANTLVIEAFAPHVYTLTKCLERVGGTVNGVVFTPLASAKSVLSKRQKELGVMLVDFGFSTTAVAVYEENKVLYVKSFPIGSGYLTNDIAIGLRTPIDAAEKLKVTYGYALAKEISRRETVQLEEVDQSLKAEISRRFLAEVIEIRLAEILDLINNDVKAIGRNVQLPAGVVLVGGGVKLAGLVDLTKQQLKLPAAIGYPDLDRLDITNPAHRELLDDPEFAGAVGLLLWGTEGGAQNLGGHWFKDIFRNLFP